MLGKIFLLSEVGQEVLVGGEVEVAGPGCTPVRSWVAEVGSDINLSILNSVSLIKK